MVHFNETTKELAVKIVYYGPAFSGKTQNLQYIHNKLAPNVKTELISLKTETERTLYFDLLSVRMGHFQGTNVRLLLHTVPGQIFYNHARSVVLQSTDAVVFVADSDKSRLMENKECYIDMIHNLKTNNIRLKDIKIVFQYNKRDLPYRLPIHVLNGELNHTRAPYFEAVAQTGAGVIETLKGLTKEVFNSISQTNELIFNNADNKVQS